MTREALSEAELDDIAECAKINGQSVYLATDLVQRMVAQCRALQAPSSDCYECNTPLIGPLCPKCNSEMLAPLPPTPQGDAPERDNDADSDANGNSRNCGSSFRVGGDVVLEKPGADVFVQNDDGKGFHKVYSVDYRERGNGKRNSEHDCADIRGDLHSNSIASVAAAPISESGELDDDARQPGGPLSRVPRSTNPIAAGEEPERENGICTVNYDANRSSDSSGGLRPNILVAAGEEDLCESSVEGHAPNRTDRTVECFSAVSGCPDEGNGRAKNRVGGEAALSEPMASVAGVETGLSRPSPADPPIEKRCPTCNLPAPWHDGLLPHPPKPNPSPDLIERLIMRAEDYRNIKSRRTAELLDEAIVALQSLAGENMEFKKGDLPIGKELLRLYRLEKTLAAKDTELETIHKWLGVCRENLTAKDEKLEAERKLAADIIGQGEREIERLRCWLEDRQAVIAAKDEALEKAETVMLIVEPRSHKKEYLDALISIQAARRGQNG